jgi:hypothetical protein
MPRGCCGPRAAKLGIDSQQTEATLIGMGRYKLPDDERKDTVFRFRVTAVDRAAIEKAARAAKKTTSGWARAVILKAAQKRSKRG